MSKWQTTPKDISEDRWVVKQLFHYVRTLSHLSISDLKYFIQTASKTKIKWHCKDSTYHVKKQKLRLNQNWPIVVEEERWEMPTGASPSLDAWDFLKYYLGMPWASPSLSFCVSLIPLISRFPKSRKLHPHKTQQGLVRIVSINQCKKNLPYSTVANH